MNFLLLPDKFKGSLTAQQLIEAITKGVEKEIPGANFQHVVASDGGDGFLDAIAVYRDTEAITTAVVDPLSRALTTTMLADRAAGDVYIEMAKASGLVLLSASERSAMVTSTRGTGMQIRKAIQQGFRKVYIGLGGSATNDAGMGMAAELGYRFLDDKGKDLDPIGSNLQHVHSIDSESVLPKLGETKVFAVNDVNNPLFGPNGAARVYAAQKGASAEEIGLLDDGLKHFDQIVKQQLGLAYASLPGAGAAGGAAYGLKCFLNAEFIGGTAFLLELANIPELIRSTKFDYILTGEGKIDSQTLSGKWINGVMELGRTYQIPVVAVCGSLEVTPGELKDDGLYDVIEVGDKERTLEYNMRNAVQFVETAVSNYFRGKLP